MQNLAVSLTICLPFILQLQLEFFLSPSRKYVLQSLRDIRENAKRDCSRDQYVTETGDCCSRDGQL